MFLKLKQILISFFKLSDLNYIEKEREKENERQDCN